MNKSDIRNDHSANAVTGNLFVAAQAGQAAVAAPGDGPPQALVASRKKSAVRRDERDDEDQVAASPDADQRATDPVLGSDQESGSLAGSPFALPAEDQPLRYAQAEGEGRADVPSGGPAQAPELEVVRDGDAGFGLDRGSAKLLLGGAVLLAGAAAGGGGGGGGGGSNVVAESFPRISDVQITGATGAQNNYLNAGDIIQVTVTTSEIVTVAGVPTIGLNIGGTVVQASYASGSGTTSLLFTYTIHAGQTDVNGISVVAGSLFTDPRNNVWIRDVASYDLVLVPAHIGVADDANYLVDTTAPNAPSINVVAGDDIINAAEQATVVTGSCVAGTTVAVAIGGTTHAATVNGTTWTYTLTQADVAAMGQGSNKIISATAADAAGNVSIAATRTVSVDTVPPTQIVTITAVIDDVAPITGIVANGGSTNDTAPVLQGTLSAALGSGDVLVIYRDGARLGTASVTGTSWTFSEPGVSNGTFVYTARVEDAPGNPGPASSPYTINVLTTGPNVALAITAIATDSGIVGDWITNDTTLTVSGTNGALGAGQKVQVSSDGVTWLDAVQVTATTWSYTDAVAHVPAPGAENLLVTYQARVVDAAGNVGTTRNQPVTIDTRPPTVPVINPVATDDIINAAETTTAISGQSDAGTTIALTLGAGNVKALTVNALGFWSYTLTAADITAMGQGPETISATATDVAGNVATGTRAITVDTVAPTVSSVAMTSAAGIQNATLNAGDVVTVTVTMSEAVIVTGAPTVGLNIGGTLVNATYASGSGTNVLAFTYTILAGQTDANGIGIDAGSIVGGTIADLAGNAATRTYVAVPDNVGYVVDTTAPTVISVAVTSATGIQNSTLNAGDIVTVTVTMSEAVLVTGAPTIALNIGGTVVNATYASGSGTNALAFTYAILAGQNDANGISIDAGSIVGGTLTDLAGNPATLTYIAVPDNAAYLVDTTPPAAPTIGVVAGDDIINAAEQAAGVTITGTCEAGATVALTLGGNTRAASVGGTTWSYLLAAADYTAMGQGAETLSATATDAAGNVSSAGTRNITIATGASADHVVGVALTGSAGAQNNYLNAGDVVTATVTMSEATTVSGSPQLALNIGGTAVQASYAAGASTPTLLRFTYTIQSGLNDTNGISIAADSLTLNGGSIVDALTNPATLTHTAVVDNGSYMVDTTAPTVASVTDNVAGTANLATADVVYTYTFSEAVSGLASGDFSVSNGSISSIGGSGATWTVHVTPQTGVASGNIGLVLAAGAVTDAAGNANSSTHTESSQAIDTVAPTCTITDDTAATADGSAPVVFTFQFSEAVTGFDSLSDISVLWGGTPGTTGAAPVSIGGNAYTLAVTPPITGGANVASVTVDIVAASIADQAGNLVTSLGADVQPYFVV